MATAAIGTLAIKFAAITSEFDSDMKKLSKQLRSISRAAEQVAKASGAAFIGMAGSIGLATKASSEVLAGQRKLAAAFKATGQSLDAERFEAFAASMQAVTTTEGDAVVEMGALMAAMNMSQGQIEGLTPGILDFAAATGKAAQDIATKLSVAVQSGDADLKRYGITMTDAEKEAFKLGSTADRTAMLMAKLGQYQGQAAAEASTAAGRFTMLTNSLGDVVEGIGAIFDKPLAATFDTGRQAADKLASVLANLSPGARDFAAAVGLSATAFLGVTAAVSTLLMFAPKLLKMWSAIRAAAIVTSTAILPIAIAIAGMAAGVIVLVGVVSKLKRFSSGGATGQDVEDQKAGFGTMLASSFAEGAEAIKQAISGALETGVEVKPLEPLSLAGIGGAVNGSAPTPIDWRGFGDEFSGKQADAEMSGWDFNGNTGGMDSGAIDDWYAESLDRIRERWDSSADRFEENMRELDAKIGEFGKSAVEGLIGSMGEAGQIAVNAMQGFQQAGPWGMVASLVISMLQRSETFRDIMGDMDGMLDQLSETMEPLFAGLRGFAGVTNVLGRYLTDFIAPVFRWFGKALGWVAQVIAAVAVVLMYIIKGIGTVWNKIIDALIWVMEKLDHLPGVNMNGTIRALQRARMDMDAVDNTIDELGDIATGASDGLTDMTDAAEAATAAMLNAPEGFKVSLARFNATTRAGSSAPTSSAGEAGASSSAPINVDTVIVQAQDPMELSRQLRRIAEIDAYNSGSTVGGGSGGRIPSRVVP